MEKFFIIGIAFSTCCGILIGKGIENKEKKEEIKLWEKLLESTRKDHDKQYKEILDLYNTAKRLNERYEKVICDVVEELLKFKDDGRLDHESIDVLVKRLRSMLQAFYYLR